MFRALELGGDTSATRRKYKARMELLCQEALKGELDEEEEAQRAALLRGWYIGEESFRDRMKDFLEASITGRKAASFTGEAKRTHDEHAARLIVEAVLADKNLTLLELQALKPGHPVKKMLTALLRKETTMSYQWILDELHMGSISSAHNAARDVKAYKGKDLRAWKELLKVVKSLH